MLDGLCSQDLGEAGFNIYELKFDMYSSYVLTSDFDVEVITFDTLDFYYDSLNPNPNR